MYVLLLVYQEKVDWQIRHAFWFYSKLVLSLPMAIFSAITSLDRFALFDFVPHVSIYQTYKMYFIQYINLL